MDLLRPGLLSALAGGVLGVGLVLGITVAVSDNTRPDIDRSANAESSLLGVVTYGSR